MEKNKNLLTADDVYTSHKTTFAQKRKAEWYQPMADYYIDLAESLNDKSKTRDALNAAKGTVSDSVMKEVLDQINDKKMAVKVKELNLLDDVDIITPVKERYMGEFVRTPNFYTCTLEGEDISLAIKHKVQKELYEIFNAKLKIKIDSLIKEEEAKQEALMEQQQAQAEAQEAQGQAPPMEDPNRPPQESMEQRGKVDAPTSAEDIVMAGLDIKEEIERIKKEFYKKEASKAKQIVDFFVKEERFEEMLYQLFYYYWATEEVYIKFEPTVGHLNISIIHPEDYLRIPSNQSILIEDDEAGVIRTLDTYKHIIDRFDKYLSKDDKSYLASILADNVGGSGVFASTREILDNYANTSDLFDFVKKSLEGKDQALFANDANNIEIYEYYYTTKRKVGILHKLDEKGLPATMVVGDSYKLNTEYGDLMIDWEWEDEVWVGYRIGKGSGVGVYTIPTPLLVQRNEMETKNTCKIPVVGLQGLLYDFGRKPIALRMLSHQALYIILTNKYRTEMAKFHGFVNLIPESILSDSDEFLQEARLEYMYKDSLLIFNDTEVDVNTLQAMRTIGNTGQADYIRTIKEMRDGTKLEAWDLANMNAERYGQIDVRGGKGNTEEAIRRVSTGSVLMFTMFDMFKERCYQAVSDYGRVVYVEGIQLNGLKDDKVVDLDIPHKKLLSMDIGINFTTNALEREKVDAIRNAVVSNSIQTGGVADAIEAIKHNDLETLSTYATKLQDAKNAREEQMAQNEQEASKYVEDKKAAQSDKELEASYKEVDLKGKYELLKKDKDIYIKMLDLKYSKELAEQGLDGNGNGVPDNYDNDDTSELTANMDYLEEEIKRQTLELAKEKVITEKYKRNAK